MTPLKHKTVLVTGGRDFTNDTAVERALDILQPKHIIHGDASSADKAAENYAIKNMLAVTAYPANWDRHGKAAGPIRNNTMLSSSEPDLILAFPGGRGTEHMVQTAHEHGYRVLKASETGSITFDTQVINIRPRGNPRDAVLIDRQTKWGNPFKITQNVSRNEVIKKFEQYFRRDFDKFYPHLVKELAGYTLACWCAPEKCHGDVLAYYANYFGHHQLYQQE